MDLRRLRQQRTAIPAIACSIAACEQDPIPFHNPPHIGYATVVKSLVCAADDRVAKPLSHASGDTAAFTSYIGIDGYVSPTEFKPGCIGAKPGIRLTEIGDGLSQTLLVGERPPPDSLQAGRWYATTTNGTIFRVNPPGPDLAMPANCPLNMGDLQCRFAGTHFGPGRTDNPCDRYHFWSHHGVGANFAFADGSVRFLTYSADPIMPALATRAGGEVVEIP